ncbi:MAG: UvrD-helicase domain-containing protein [Aquificae bacterium]|nr:UvrD-helicase domain-containing protein [Aquificota bacterium]
MPNTHYIASAGTGKTYHLIHKVIQILKKENISLKDLLILTFTEKASLELKTRILNQLKQELNLAKTQQERLKIHKEIFFSSDSYIGTFHSIFFRILKNYPKESLIDNSYEILAEDIDLFLERAFEKWIEEDYTKNKDIWIELARIYNQTQIKTNLFLLYKNRLKIKESRIKLNKRLIEDTVKNLEEKLEYLFKKYGDFLKEFRYENEIFRNSPYQIEKLLKEGNYTELPTNEPKTVFFYKSFLFKRPKDKKSAKILKHYLEPIEKLDKQIGKLTQLLKKETLNYNANLLLDRFLSFLEFVEKEKKEQRKIDFNDILQKTLKLLENPKIQKEIKQKFKYIFVDEFQDTDSYQIKILEKLLTDNLYIFGDPKQCIYTWRDADLDAYLDFVQKQPFKEVTLNKNYRSSPKLTEFFNQAFTTDAILSHISPKYRQPLQSKKNQKESLIKLFHIKHSEKQSTEHIKLTEAKFCAYLVDNLIKEGNSPQDIMILFRTNEDLNLFLKIFQHYKIPVNAYSNENLFDQPQIKQIIHILEFIETPHSKLSLLNLLKSPLFFLTDKELYEYRESLDIQKIKTSLFDFLKYLIEYRYDLTPEEIIDKLLQNTNLLEVFASSKDKEQKLLNIEYLKRISQKLSMKNYSLREFILFCKTAKVEIPTTSNQKAVQLLTMHKAKGLQSKIVIIPLISLRPNSIKLNNIHIHNQTPLLNLKKARSSKLDEVEQALKEKIQDELKRLFYVAVTRAEEKLIFIKSSPLSKSNHHSFENLLKKALPAQSTFIEEEIITKIEPVPQKTTPTPKALEKNLKKELQKIQKIEKELSNMYKKAFETQKFISVTQAMQNQFIYKQEKKEIDKQASLYIGILVHEILEEIDILEYSFKKAQILLKEKINTIPKTLKKEVSKNALKIFDIFQKSNILKELKQSKILAKEMPFVIKEKDFFVEGRLDLLYEKEEKVIILDYKTNRYETKEQLQSIIDTYKVQKEYYKKAVEKIFPHRKIEFKLALLWKGDLVKI